MQGFQETADRGPGSGQGQGQGQTNTQARLEVGSITGSALLAAGCY